MSFLNNITKKIVSFVLVFLLFIAFSILGIWIGPEKIVEVVGIEGGYLLAFIVALFGGLSIFSSPLFYSTIVTLVLGGLDPVILSVVTGFALAIGDSFVFFVAQKGRSLFSGFASRLVNIFSRWINSRPMWIVQWMTFLYVGFSPLSNDIAMTTLAIGKYPYKKIAIPLLLGDIVLVFLVSFFTLLSFGRL